MSTEPRVACKDHWELDCKICNAPDANLKKGLQAYSDSLETLVDLSHIPAFRHKTSKERKAEPIYSGVLAYFPDALAAVARVSKAGNDKHNPGEPLHWARGKSTDQMDCAIRHSLTPGVIDPETNEPELAHMAWRILAELQIIEEKALLMRGIRPYSGVTKL